MNEVFEDEDSLGYYLESERGFQQTEPFAPKDMDTLNSRLHHEINDKYCFLRLRFKEGDTFSFHD